MCVRTPVLTCMEVKFHITSCQWKNGKVLTSQPNCFLFVGLGHSLCLFTHTGHLLHWRVRSLCSSPSETIIQLSKIKWSSWSMIFTVLERISVVVSLTLVMTCGADAAIRQLSLYKDLMILRPFSLNLLTPALPNFKIICGILAKRWPRWQ